MDTKLIEIRDRGTLIPALAIKLGPANEAEHWLLARAGYGPDRERQETYVLLTPLAGREKGKIFYDESMWDNTSRTLSIAHSWMMEYFDKVQTGDVVDIEYLLGEVEIPKWPERETE